MGTAQPQGTATLGKLAILTAFLQNGAVGTVTNASCEVIPSVSVAASPETRRTSSRTSSSFKASDSVVGTFVTGLAETDNAALRPTTKLEKLVGELRSWRLLAANWDGEGAACPSDSSLKQAELFARLYRSSTGFPEAMLNANGHAGLSWNETRLYADLEFLGDGRLAYYVERNGDKHKGVTKFNSEEVPAVLEVLLGPERGSTLAV